MKFATDGLSTSSTFEAIMVAVKPTNCNLTILTARFDKKRSIRLRVRNRVSGNNFNFHCTSTSQSTKMALIGQFNSFWLSM